MNPQKPHTVLRPTPHSAGKWVAGEDLKQMLFGHHDHGPQPTFQSLFCERFGCTPAEFERQVFCKCLYWRARLLAPLLLKLNPDFFAEDFHFIQLVGRATSMDEVSAEALWWRGEHRVRTAVSLTGGHIRVSGRKVVQLAWEAFQKEACGARRSSPPARTNGVSRPLGAEASCRT